MRIIKYVKGIALPKADYIFDKLSDFKKIAPYLRRKVEGEWCIILLNFKYKHIEEVIAMNLPEYTNIDFYVAPDVKEALELKYSQLVIKDKSNYDLYLDYLLENNILLDNNVTREIYTRNRGNLSEIQITLKKIKENKLSAKDDTGISVKDIDKVIAKDDRVFAKDVIYAYLLYDKKIPAKGSRLSRYRYLDRKTLKSKFLESLDTRTAFYACRKVLKNLYDEQINYLNSKDCKEVEMCKVVDYYEVAHAWLTFKLSKPDHLEICLLNIERRKSNDSIFKDTILGINT